MEIVKAFKFRLVPTKKQAGVLRSYIGATRWLWNRGLDYLHARYERGERGDYYERKFKDGTKKGYSFAPFMKPGDGLAAMWVKCKREPENAWLLEHHSHSVRDVLRVLDRAWRRAKTRRNDKLSEEQWGYPHYKKPGDIVSFALPAGSYKLRDGRAYLGRKGKFGDFDLGGIKMRPNRGRRRDPCAGYIPADWTPTAARLKEEGGKFYLCVSAKYAGERKVAPHQGEAVGIDMNIERPYVLSTRMQYGVKRFDKRIIPKPGESASPTAGFHKQSVPEETERKWNRLEARRKRYQRRMSRLQEYHLRGVGWDRKSETRRAAEIRLGKKRGNLKEAREKWRTERAGQLKEWEQERAKAETGGMPTPPRPGSPPRPARYSNKYELARRRMAKATRALMHIRHNALHHISSEIVRDFGLIFVENLKHPDMRQSPKGTKEKPGKNVAQKRGMNRNFAANAPGLMRAMLDYKSRWAGGQMEKVAAAYTSQRCAESECGHVDKKNRPKRPTMERFKCVKCGHEDNADVNAAENILWKGLEDLKKADGVKASGRGFDGDKGRRSGKRQTPVEQREATSGTGTAETPKMADKKTAMADGVRPPLFYG